MFDRQRDALGAIATCSMKGDPRVLAFVQHVRKAGFTGPVIACSSVPQYQDEMRTAGCDKDVVEVKDRLPVHLVHILREGAPSPA